MALGGDGIGRTERRRENSRRGEVRKEENYLIEKCLLIMRKREMWGERKEGK